MTCPKCNTGMLQSNGMLGHNWTCELCGYTQWSPTLGSPGSGSGSYSSGGITYSDSGSYSSSNITGNYTPKMSPPYRAKPSDDKLYSLNKKALKLAKERRGRSQDIKKIEEEKDPKKRQEMLDRYGKELDKSHKELRKLEKELKKYEKRYKFGLGEAIGAIVLAWLLFQFFS